MKQLLVILLLCTSVAANAQYSSFQWMHPIGDAGNDCPGQIAADSSGNLYATGSFVGTLIFGSDTITSTSISNASMFIVKYDTAGNPLWARKLPITNTAIGDCSNFTISKVRIVEDRIYMLGEYTYSLFSYGFLYSYRDDGTLVGYYDNAVNTTMFDLDADSLGNTYLGGYFSVIGTAFLISYDSSGNTRWQVGYAELSKIISVKYLPGGVHVAGEFQGQVHLIDSFGTTAITLNAATFTTWGLFTAKYAADGHLLSGMSSAGIPPVYASAEPAFSADYTPTGAWRVIYSSKDQFNNVFENVRKYSPAFFTGVTQVLPLTASFPPVPYIKSSTFSEDAADYWTGILCTPAYAYTLDTASSQTKDSLLVPFAYNGAHDFAFDLADNPFITSVFQGSMSYTTGTGAHSVSSVGGTPDIYVGKYHKCASYAPAIIVHGDTLFCSDSGLTYNWYSTGSSSSVGVGQSFVPSTSGTYYVKISDAWGCGATSGNQYVYVPVGIAELSMSKNIQVYPNPVTSQFTIQGMPLHTLFKITDLAGKVLVGGVSDMNEPIDISAFPSGMYLLKSKFGVKKLVKL